MVERESEEEWQITQPETLKADDAKIRQLLSDAGFVIVQQFVSDAPEDLAQYGLDAPSLKIRLWEQEHDVPHELLFGSVDQEQTGLYAKIGDQDTVVLVNAEALEQLRKTAFELCDKKILAFDLTQVEKIQLTYPEQNLTLKKDGDEWKATEPEDKRLAFFKVNNLLHDLAELEFAREIAESAADPDQYGLAEPEITLTIWDGADHELLTLLIGQAVVAQDLRYVKLASDAVVYGIDPQFLQDLPENLADLEE